ncbi:uncharacterized protein BJ212DRAFT_1280118, partial [Suillus subaureus]
DSASIAAVIPAMDRLDDHLNNATRCDYHPAIKVAMKLARNKMDRYWRHTDQSHISLLMCSITVLHPGLKLEYFRKQNWDAEWIEEAVALTRAEYSTNYEGIVVTTTDSTMAAATNEPTPFFGFGDYSRLRLYPYSAH